MFNTPVLLVVFNRPIITRKTLSAIKAIKPKFLFVAADGPRKNVPTDEEKCREVRKVIDEIVDWDCELKTLYRDENRSCGRSVSEAITWFFQHVESGIILEDDCLPSKSFFPYCDELLNRFQNDDRIWVISGFNRLKSYYPERHSYFFSRMVDTYDIWGWATWRRAWEHFD